MNRRNKIMAAVLLLAALLAVIGPVNRDTAQAQEALARVRFLHAVPGAPDVDIYLDGDLLASGVSFGSATPHINVAGGEHQVALRQTGIGDGSPVLVEVPVPLVANLAFTVVVQGIPAAVEAALYEDILDELAPGMARLTAINAVVDAPALDVLTSEGGPLLQGVSYGAQFGTVNIGTGMQDLLLVPAGGAVESAIAPVGAVALQSGTLYTFVALGTLDSVVAPFALVLATPVNVAAEALRVRLAHGSPDTPAVDVYANDTLIVPSLGLGQMSGHISLPAGDTRVDLRPAGTPSGDPPVFSTNVTLVADVPAVTLAVVGQMADQSLTLQVFEDNVTGIPADKARISVVNAVPGATASVGFADEDATVLASDLADSAQGAAVDVAVDKYMLMASISGIDSPVDVIVPEEAYYGGMYYSVLVYGGGATAAPYDARVAGTEVSLTADSLLMPMPVPAVVAAPSAGTEVAMADTEAMPNEGVAAADTEVVAGEAPPVGNAPPPASDTELVVDAAPPAAPPVAPPPQADQNVPVATVELNPGANLHCREYPRADAKSLTLIPSGTVLTVIGRTGEPLVPETGNATPEPTPVVETLDDLWVSVRWDPPGGGYVRCWVAAKYLRIELKGKFLLEIDDLLEKLAEEPFNRPGEVVGADVAPPEHIFDAVLATVNLNPGVSLQLRRHPNSDAEVLARVPAQAQLEVLGYVEAPSEGLVGQPTDPYWLRVRYRLENGGAIVGWVSAQYVFLTQFDRQVEILDLELLDPAEGGEFEAEGEPWPIPLEEQDVIGVVNLDPGANLNLRDRPSIDAFVVVGIPSGESMVLNGRNGDGTWVQVTYESPTGTLDGWTASQYLVITRGGQPWPIKDLDNLTDEEDAMTG